MSHDNKFVFAAQGFHANICGRVYIQNKYYPSKIDAPFSQNMHKLVHLLLCMCNTEVLIHSCGISLTLWLLTSILAPAPKPLKKKKNTRFEWRPVSGIPVSDSSHPYICHPLVAFGQMIHLWWCLLLRQFITAKRVYRARGSLPAGLIYFLRGAFSITVIPTVSWRRARPSHVKIAGTSAAHSFLTQGSFQSACHWLERLWPP